MILKPYPMPPKSPMSHINNQQSPPYPYIPVPPSPYSSMQYQPSGCQAMSYMNPSQYMEQSPYMEQSSYPNQKAYPMYYNSDINNHQVLLPMTALDDYVNYDNMESDITNMKEMYPDATKEILYMIEEECDKLEYDGSFMFDDIPSKSNVSKLSNMIYDKVKHLDAASIEPNVEATAAVPFCHNCKDRPNWLKNLIDIMIFNEMHNRRHRRNHRKRIFY